MLQSITASQELRQNLQQQIQDLKIDAVVFAHFIQPFPFSLSITSGITISGLASVFVSIKTLTSSVLTCLCSDDIYNITKHKSYKIELFVKTFIKRIKTTNKLL
jgi:hypothetical protein